MKLSLLGAAVLSHMAGDAPNPPLSCVLSTGKILFRRSHVRDVAVKRLKPIDEYCRVRLWGAQPSCLGAQGATRAGISLLESADIHHREGWSFPNTTKTNRAGGNRLLFAPRVLAAFSLAHLLYWFGASFTQ